MKIFYHDDLDGRCAATIAHDLQWGAELGTRAFPMNYGIDFPFDIIDKDEKVYILDFSIEPSDMKKLLTITERVVWIDHHKTAIERYADFLWVDSGMAERTGSEVDISGVRATWGAGCELTYAYLYAHSKHVPVHIAISRTPEYVQLIGDRDTWTFKHGDKTRHFFAGMQSYDTKPSSWVWQALANDADGNDGDLVSDVVADGAVIQRYKNQTQQESIREKGFWIDFHGHKSYAVNGGRGSEPFEAVVPEAEIWIAFSYMPGGYWTVSLYSDKIDVSEIAKQYEYDGKRGGGHPGASGFQCDYPPFLNKKG